MSRAIGTSFSTEPLAPKPFPDTHWQYEMTNTSSLALPTTYPTISPCFPWKRDEIQWQPAPLVGAESPQLFVRVFTEPFIFVQIKDSSRSLKVDINRWMGASPLSAKEGGECLAGDDGWTLGRDRWKGLYEMIEAPGYFSRPSAMRVRILITKKAYSCLKANGCAMRASLMPAERWIMSDVKV